MGTPSQFALYLLRLLAVSGMIGLDSTSAPCQDQQFPRDQAEFTRFMIGKIQHQLPTFSVKPLGPLTVEAKRFDGSGSVQINLDRLWATCSRDATRCSDVVAHFISALSDVERAKADPINKSIVRLVVRSEAAVAQAKQQLATLGLITRRLISDLWVVPVLDYPRAIRFATADDLRTLGLNEDGIFDLGRRNLREKLRPIRDVVQELPPKGIGQIAGDDYDSSRIILHSEWAPIATKFKQNLVVMVPASNLLLYGDGSTVAAIDAMRTFAREAAKRSQRPISGIMLRWAPNGWEVVP